MTEEKWGRLAQSVLYESRGVDFTDADDDAAHGVAGEVMEMSMVAWAGRQVRLWNVICSIPFPVEEVVLYVRAESVAVTLQLSVVFLFCC
jgi:hypothetical protein